MRPEKVAIVGTSESTRGQAPYGNEEWDIWALGVDHSFDRADLLFEMHTWDSIDGYPIGDGHDKETIAGYLNFLDVPVYMIEHNPEIPKSLAYPFEEAAKAIHMPLRDGDGGYFESSIGYMLALCVLWKVPHVGLWGVDLATGGEYAYQRPNAEYLIGLLRGMGSKVYVPKESAILSSKYTKPPYRYQ